MIAPVEKNKEYIIAIESVTNEGNGVGHIDGFTVFVPDTVRGDLARIMIVKVNNRYAYGKLTEIMKASDMRVEPICPLFGKCGGCQLLHISYAEQLKIKEGIIHDALTRIGGFTGFEFQGVMGMENPYEYRNKLIFPIGLDRGAPVCGFYALRSHRVVPVDRCFLGDQLHSKILRTVENHIKKYNLTAYDEQNHSGLFRRVFVRQGFVSKEVMVVLSVNGKMIEKSVELVENITKINENIVSIVLNVNEKRTNLVLGDKNIVLYGREYINDTLCGAEYKVSPHSFFQVNPYQTERLYQKAIDFANINCDDTVMDVYCGIGTISLLCARKAKSVVGIEIVPKAISDAKENAVQNGITNVSFLADSAENAVPELVRNGERPNIVMIDPPRKGSDEKTLSAIVDAAPGKIVYVSCNPSTLARDAEFLSQNGYVLKKVAGFDMFPHTVHVECVVCMQRKDTL